MNSKELFDNSNKPMSNRESIILQSKAIELLESKTLTEEQASAFIGMKYKEGTIIGVTSKPGLKYPDGIYITVTYSDKPTEYILVGEV